jgi:transposase, IS30 family
MECMGKGTRYTQLSYEERVKIAALRDRGESIRSIARLLARSPNTVAREWREKQVKGLYVPKKAQHKTYWRRYRSKRNCMKVAMSRTLTRLIRETLPLGWSPERIAGYARRNGIVVSKKAVYKFLKSRCLERYLFWRRNKKKAGPKRVHASPADQEKRMVDARPPTRSSGHWELDFIVSSLSGAVLLVMVDRWTRYTIVEKLERKTHEGVLRVLADIGDRHGMKTITTDNDIVFRAWREMETGLPGVRFHFCRPYHSWEKGLVENTNRWIRCFVPKRTDLATVSDDTLRSIHQYLNELPSQCLGYSTASEVLSAHRVS